MLASRPTDPHESTLSVVSLPVSIASKVAPIWDPTEPRSVRAGRLGSPREWAAVRVLAGDRAHVQVRRGERTGPRGVEPRRPPRGAELGPRAACAWERPSRARGMRAAVAVRWTSRVGPCVAGETTGVAAWGRARACASESRGRRLRVCAAGRRAPHRRSVDPGPRHLHATWPRPRPRSRATPVGVPNPLKVVHALALHWGGEDGGPAVPDGHDFR